MKEAIAACIGGGVSAAKDSEGQGRASRREIQNLVTTGRLKRVGDLLSMPDRMTEAEADELMADIVEP